MAYGEKYRFTWRSSGGSSYSIRVFQNGFTGTRLARHMGQAPVLRRERNGAVLGTSLEFYPECAVDQEFSEFYTSDPKEFRVELRDSSDAVLWAGYITPELYSEPDVAPPYDVQVIATDGIGELKLETFAPAGRVSLLSHFESLLEPTGLTRLFGVSSLMHAEAHSDDLMSRVHMDLDFKAGESKYDVLTYLLESLQCGITWFRSDARAGSTVEREYGWLLLREPDLESAIGSDGVLTYIDYTEQAALEMYGTVMHYGSLGEGSSVWPVGRMTTSVEAAKRTMTVEAPWHGGNGLVNPDMTSDTGWTKSPGTTYYSALKAYRIDTLSGEVMQSLSQSIDFSTLLFDKPVEVSFRVARAPQLSTAATKCYLRAEFVDSYGLHWWVGRDSDDSIVWSHTSVAVDCGQITSEGTDGTSSQEVRLTVPALYDSAHSRYAKGTLTVYCMTNNSLMVFHGDVYCQMGAGWRDEIVIDNSARGEGEKVEIAFGKVDSSVVGHAQARFLQGVAAAPAGAPLPNRWYDAHWSNLDFLALASRGRALSVALPRIRTTGTLSIPNGYSPGALFIKQVFNNVVGTDMISFVEEFTCDLLNDEIEVSALSLPAAELSVAAESVTPITGDQTGNTTPGGGGGGGGGGVIVSGVQSVGGYTGAVTRAQVNSLIDLSLDNYNFRSPVLHLVPDRQNGEEWLSVRHPLMGVVDGAEYVLMHNVYGGKARRTGSHDSKGWRVVWPYVDPFDDTDYRRVDPFVFTSQSVSAASLFEYLVANCLVVSAVPGLAYEDYAHFCATRQYASEKGMKRDSHSAFRAGRGHLGHFAIALRVPNPAFNALLISGAPLDDDTQALKDPDTDAVVPRWLYSEPGRFDVFCCARKVWDAVLTYDWRMKIWIR